MIGALLFSLGLAQVQSMPSPSPYAPYRFLIGEWNVGRESGSPTAIVRFRWGPNESYIWVAASLVQGTREVPHFEGMLVWNGVRRNLDMLLSLELDGRGVQEQGTVFVRADGTVVREITAIYPEGSRPIGQPPVGPRGQTARFRQTFQAAGPDRIVTALLRQTAAGWVPTFAGSDRLVMTRLRELAP